MAPHRLEPSFRLSSTVLSPGEAHLWCAYPEDLRDARLLRRYESLLSSSERVRYHSLRFDRHRSEFLVTRALVRAVLSRYCPVGPKEWKFRPNPHGRPELDPPRELRFNLANALRMVVCIVSRGSEVGVDIEPFERARAVVELAAEVFSPRERALMRRIAEEERPDCALSLWTLKESYIKARGMGLALPLQRFSFPLDESGPIRIELERDIGDRSSRWRFALIDRAAHRIAVTLELSGLAAPRVRVWDSVPLESATEVSCNWKRGI